MTRDTTTDVGALLDEGSWSGYQKLLVAATALTIIFDGLDNQLLGAAIPSMMREWALPRPAFATVLAAALFGMMIGGFIGGWVGDRFGRKQALIWSVLAMAVPSFFIGLLPGEATIGIAAPVLLVVFRLLQGLAVGGEYMASSVFLVEGSVAGRRGWMGSWSPFGASVGTLLGAAAGALVNATMSPEAVMAYGWRIPFIVGLAVGLGGFLIRSQYVERVPHQPPAKSPLGEAVRVHWRTILHLVALVAGLAVGFYTSAVYASAWLAQVAGVPARTAFTIDTIAMAISLPFILYAGHLSDRIGRRRVLVVTSGLLMVVGLPLMALMARGHLAGILVGQIVLLGLVSAISGVLPAAMAELAPWRVRCTVVSIAYNVGMALLGGTTPLVAVWLVSRSGYALAPAWYLTAAGALAFVAAILLPKTLPHRLTTEFHAMRSAEARTAASRNVVSEA